MNRQLMTIAAHELGHAVAARHFDLDVGDITVYGDGPSVHGKTGIIDLRKGSRFLDPESYPHFDELYRLCVVLLAGQAATDYWIQENCGFPQFSAQKDYDHIRLLESLHTYDFPWADGKDHVEALIVNEWSRIRSWVKRLADEGYLHGSWL